MAKVIDKFNKFNKLIIIIILCILLLSMIYKKTVYKYYNKLKKIISIKESYFNMDNEVGSLINYGYDNIEGNSLDYEYNKIQHSDYIDSENLKNNLTSIFKADYSSYKLYPDGQISNDGNLFINNKFLPECCRYHSEYSNSKGCPCITPDQQLYLQRRGGNRHKSSFIHDGDLTNLYFSPTNVLKGISNETFLHHSTYITRDSPPLSDLSRNIVYSMIYMDDR